MAEKFVHVSGPFYHGDTYEYRLLKAEEGESLIHLLMKNGFESHGCLGKGECLGCKVKYKVNAPLPTADERRLLLPSELRDGYRLACRHTVTGNTYITLPELSGEEEMSVILPERNISEDADEAGDRKYFIAADIGTTTIAMQAISFDSSGKTLATFTAMNPQRQYGTDVISRVSAAEEGHEEELGKLLWNCIDKGISVIERQLIRKPEYLLLTGNTVMNYFLRGLPVQVFGKAPFGPVDTKTAYYEHCGIMTYIAPGFSAFAGGDLVTGIVALDRRNARRPYLLIDLGTNGEIILRMEDRILGTATAAGPAFEGGVTAHILGADLVDVLALLLHEGMLDKSGMLIEPYCSEGITYGNITLSQKDIRNLQLAKAATITGIKTLLDKTGISTGEISDVFLAGGFGYYVKPEQAVEIGLIPASFEGRIRSVGNTALEGIIHIGRVLAEGNVTVDMANQVVSNLQEETTIINLANEPDFEEKYMRYLPFTRIY